MPRMATGYWNARKSPSRARSSGCSAASSLPRYCADPVVMMYAGFPASTWASVLLPEPLGPMMACTSPACTVRSMPRRMGLPSTVTCRFLMVSISPLLSTDRPFETHTQQLLRFHRELHRQLLEHLLAEAV